MLRELMDAPKPSGKHQSQHPRGCASPCWSNVALYWQKQKMNVDKIHVMVINHEIAHYVRTSPSTCRWHLSRPLNLHQWPPACCRHWHEVTGSRGRNTGSTKAKHRCSVLGAVDHRRRLMKRQPPAYASYSYSSIILRSRWLTPSGVALSLAGCSHLAWFGFRPMSGANTWMHICLMHHKSLCPPVHMSMFGALFVNV